MSANSGQKGNGGRGAQKTSANGGGLGLWAWCVGRRRSHWTLMRFGAIAVTVAMASLRSKGLSKRSEQASQLGEHVSFSIERRHGRRLGSRSPSWLSGSPSTSAWGPLLSGGVMRRLVIRLLVRRLCRRRICRERVRRGRRLRLLVRWIRRRRPSVVPLGLTPGPLFLPPFLLENRLTSAVLVRFPFAAIAIIGLTRTRMVLAIIRQRTGGLRPARRRMRWRRCMREPLSWVRVMRLTSIRVMHIRSRILSGLLGMRMREMVVSLHSSSFSSSAQSERKKTPEA
jgi:hypothetical protein